MIYILHWGIEVDLISQRRENVLFLPSNMAAIDITFSIGGILNKTYSGPEKANQLNFPQIWCESTKTKAQEHLAVSATGPCFCIH